MSAISLAVLGRGLVDPAEPVVRADDDALARGRAVFETLRAYDGRPFRLREHLERLARSASRVGLDPPPLDELEQLARLALAAAGTGDSTLRLYWTPGPPGGSPTGLALVGAIPAWIEPARATGQRLVSLYAPRRSEPWLLPATKSTSYAVNMAAEAEAKRRGGDDAVFVDEKGVVLEGPVTNIWWRHGTVLRTPSLELGILAGETRAVLLELAPGCGYAVEEGRWHLGAVTGADEIFTSSSVREVMPVVELDGLAVGRGPAADALQAALRSLATL
jgi:4-amino-4-deoxychorismate lyase